MEIGRSFSSPWTATRTPSDDHPPIDGLQAQTMDSDYIVCRGCMCKEPSSLEWMKNENVDFQTLKLIYTDLTRLEVADDDTLPQHLCQKCCDSLGEFNAFKQTCITSYHTLSALDIKDEMLDNDNQHYEDVDNKFKVEPEVFADSLGCSNSSSSEVSRRRQAIEVKKKHEKRKIVCTEPGCSSKFSSKSAFNSHQSYHRGEAYECDYCQKKVSSLKILQRHLRSHIESNAAPSKPKSPNKPHQFRCLEVGCNKSFIVEDTYLAHKRAHEDGISASTCDICHKEMATVKGMLLHRLTHQALEERQKMFQCQKCFKQFANKYRLQTHLKHHEMGKHVICDECGMTFHNVTKLKLHQKSHNTEATFVCELCPKAYKTYNTLYSHKQTAHGLNKPDCICQICNKQFTTTTGLYKHRKMIHTVYTTTENIFACNLCEVKCKDSKLLKEHKRLHTGERKFACTMCSKTFAHRTLLNRHAYFHSGDRPVHCEVCQKGFYTKHALNIHMNVHKRLWISQGLQGIELFGYCRNKNK